MQTERCRRQAGSRRGDRERSRHDHTNITPASRSEVRGIIGSLKAKKSTQAPRSLTLACDSATFRPDGKTRISFSSPSPERTLPQNYRPISFLSNIDKILKKVILTWLVRENFIIPDEQFGFRPQHFIVDQLINVTEFISRGLNVRQSTGAIFLDVAKAFDTIWHDGFVYKLHTSDVPLVMVKLINSYLEHCIFLSTEREIQAGAPQGSVLSPTLYPMEQRSRCMQTTLQFLRAPGHPNSLRSGLSALWRVWSYGF
jgi:hypothetical protein